MSQSLLQTEMTDAVNSGIVDRADKSEKSLKSALYSVGKKTATGGATSAALAAVTKGRKGASSAEPSSASGSPIPGSDTAAPDGAIGAVISSSTGGRRKGRSARPGAATGTASGGGSRLGAGHSSFGTASGAAGTASGATSKGGRFGESLKAGAKRTGKGAATRRALENTELEGADDLYYKGKGAYRAVRGIQKRMAGKDALSSEKSLGKLSEKKSHGKGTDTLEAKRQAQAKGYFKKNVYDAAEKAKTAAAVEKGVSGKILASKGGSGLLMSIASPTLPFLLCIVLVLFVFLGIIGGIAADDAQKKASLDGMPGWVSYELVLSCLKAHEEYGYPASALLGQMMIENGTSDEGSDLGRLYHNYGGIKYFGNMDGLITGSVRLLTTEYVNGTPVKVYADFAVFASDEAYMKYRCEHLYKQPNYTNVPDFQKAIEENNSELFLKALGEGGYYTASTDSYIAQYRSICESYPLVPRLDSMTSKEFEEGGGNAFYPGGGQDYASAQQWQKDIVNACYRTPWPGIGLCATWTSNVYAAAGHPTGGNGNTVLGNQGYGANYYPSRATTDLSQIQVGMMVSAQFGSNTAAGNTYGHVGIYIGDGMVMDSVSSGIRTISLSEWVSQNGRGWVVCGYPWDWR